MVSDIKKLPKQKDLDMDEEKMRIQGENYQKIAFTSDYLDEYDYDVQVISESLFQKDSATAQALIQDKIATMAKFFPQIFAVNQPKIFEDFSNAYGEDPSRYDLEPPQPAPVPGMENIPGMPGAENMPGSETLPA
jgi:hypothetical protein